MAVVVALKEELRELWAVTSAPHPWRNQTFGAEDYLLLAPCVSGRPYRVIVFLMGDMGPPAAAQAANRLLTLQPALAVSLGIACSLDDKDLRLCDVIVADQVDGYDEKGKAVDDGKDGWTFERGGEVFRVTDDIVRLADGLEFGEPAVFDVWRKACAEDLDVLVSDEEVDRQAVETLRNGRKLRKTPNIVKGHLASGMTVAAAKAFRQWVLERDRNLKALEMEAVGVLRAAHQRKVPVGTLVLRGISDLGDGDKKVLDAIGDGALRKAAMRNAARLLWALMRSERLPRADVGPQVEPQMELVGSAVISRPAQPPSLPDDRPLNVEHVADLLAHLLSDPHEAALVATRAGFPRAKLPVFTSSLLFWHTVVQAAEAGVLAGGARPLLEQAARVYPHNPKLADWRS